ncbi:MAG TPA: RdgB/HAM1 family non-canonical purine NTP pyrophosphatase [Gammaproteobacteria bacterium]|nr:RdgB/HAM1 family non-canonical purine NTP pyrophosphatase [Gammaproteobacteria bacterium]
MRIVIATGNAGKLAEILTLLAPLGFDAIAQAALGIAPAAETAPSFVENAILKARGAARAAHLPALADDSGLEVPALGGAPGVHSARYAGRHGDDAANVAKLLAELAVRPGASRRARFRCVAVYLRAADDPAPIVAEATWEGEIAAAPRGKRGFGYDPVFLLPALGITAAELPAAEKNRLSHRARALLALRERLAIERGESSPQ